MKCQPYKDGFILKGKVAYCPYCGHKMQDKGDSWFCADTDCINNVRHPKVKKEVSRAEMCWEHLLYLCEKRFSTYDMMKQKTYTKVQIFRHGEGYDSPGCPQKEAVTFLLPKTDDGEEIVLYRDGTWGIV